MLLAQKVECRHFQDRRVCSIEMEEIDIHVLLDQEVNLSTKLHIEKVVSGANFRAIRGCP